MTTGIRSSNSSTSNIQEHFHDLKQELANVSEEDWAGIPDCIGDASLRHKKARTNNNPLNEGTIVSDALLVNHSNSKNAISKR